MLLHLFSDANYNLLGFNATYRVSLCPHGCSGRGACGADGRCLCPPGWGGPACQDPACPTYCQAHGTCSQVSQGARGGGGGAGVRTAPMTGV